MDGWWRFPDVLNCHDGKADCQDLGGLKYYLALKGKGTGHKQMNSEQSLISVFKKVKSSYDYGYPKRHCSSGTLKSCRYENKHFLNNANLNTSFCRE